MTDRDPPAALSRTPRRALFLVFLLALAVRVACVQALLPAGQLAQAWGGVVLAVGVARATAFLPSHGSPQSEVGKVGLSLATGGTLGDLDAPGPTARVSPLYPALLAALYRLWGPDYLRPQELLAALATAATIALVPVLGRRLGLRPAVCWAAAVCAALLPLHWIETDGRWEQPLTGLVLTGLLLLAAGLQDCAFRSPRRVAAFGLLMALGGLLAPQAILPTGALALLGAWIAGRAGAPRALASGAAVAMVCLILWTPWTARNYLEFGEFVPLRSNFGLELRLGNCPEADRPGETSAHDHPTEDGAQAARLSELGEPAYMREQRQLALGWIADHPGRFAALCARRFRQFWFPSPRVFFAANPTRGAVSAAFLWSTGALALAGLLWLIVGRHRYRWLLVAGLFGPSLLYLITTLHGRYRYPIFALSLLVAFELVFRLAAHLRRRREPVAGRLEAVTADLHVAAFTEPGS